MVSKGGGPLPTIQEEKQSSIMDGGLELGQSGQPSILKSSLKSRSVSMPFSRAGSVIRLDNCNMTSVFREIMRRESIMPPKHKHNFKIKYGRKTND